MTPFPIYSNGQNLCISEGDSGEIGLDSGSSPVLGSIKVSETTYYAEDVKTLPGECLYVGVEGQLPPGS